VTESQVIATRIYKIPKRPTPGQARVMMGKSVVSLTSERRTGEKGVIADQEKKNGKNVDVSRRGAHKKKNPAQAIDYRHRKTPSRAGFWRGDTATKWEKGLKKFWGKKKDTECQNPGSNGAFFASATGGSRKKVKFDTMLRAQIELR